MAGLVPCLLLAQINARVRPDLPWAAVAALAYLGMLLPYWATSHAYTSAYFGEMAACSS